MIVEVTYEGNGIFKVWPPPSETDVRTILTAIKIIDPSNAEEGACEHGTPFRYACLDCAEFADDEVI